MYRIGLSACAALVLAGCNSTEPASTGLLQPPEHHALESGGASLDENVAREMISLYRKTNGLAEVANDPALQKAAQFQANAMAEAGRLDHNVKGTFLKRIAACGRGRGYAVENVSAGYKSFDAALAGWRRSKLHNENLLEPHVRRMGIATAYAPEARYKVFWALIMSD
ncbi:hypothetical protein B1812_00495 [Methylocystis bryophila]|uniref:SCP domain-containing protein n=1 Tax=Methylocystis bryophila TaxID=655015 RepID=A0A1W6N0E5_9HYPH|nr:hypothetical protein B1812_00495 [Methylocystis bryophila]